MAEALAGIPVQIPILLDLKADPAEPRVKAVAGILQDAKAWGRVRLYSTQAGHLRLMKASHPQAQVFEEPDLTRMRLVERRLGGSCGQPPPAGTWVGFELKRSLDVTGKYTLGEGRSGTVAKRWDRAAMACCRTHPGVKIVLFGVATEEDLAIAETLGVDAVMTDSPRIMRAMMAAKAARMTQPVRGR